MADVTWQQLARPLLEDFEQGPHGGPALEAYPDGGGTWTIGYGHTGLYPHEGQVAPGDKITAAQATDILTWDIDRTGRGIAPAVKFPANAYQYAAMAALAFDIGVGAFSRSHVLAAITAHLITPEMQPVVKALWLRWSYVHVEQPDGSFLPVQEAGLVRRRNAEIALWDEGLRLTLGGTNA